MLALREVYAFKIDKGGYYSMNNMVISNDSLLVYDLFPSVTELRVHRLDQDIPVISWYYGASDRASEGDFDALRSAICWTNAVLY